MSVSGYPIEENIRDGICKLNAYLLSVTEPSLSTAIAEHGVSGAGGEGRGAVGLRLGSCLQEAHRLAGALRETHKQSTGNAVIRALRGAEHRGHSHCGDQGSFVAKAHLHQLGGMGEIRICEDVGERGILEGGGHVSQGLEVKSMETRSSVWLQQGGREAVRL